MFTLFVVWVLGQSPGDHGPALNRDIARLSGQAAQRYRTSQGLEPTFAACAVFRDPGPTVRYRLACSAGTHPDELLRSDRIPTAWVRSP